MKSATLRAPILKIYYHDGEEKNFADYKNLEI